MKLWKKLKRFLGIKFDKYKHKSGYVKVFDWEIFIGDMGWNTNLFYQGREVGDATEVALLLSAARPPQLIVTTYDEQHDTEKKRTYGVLR